MPRTVNFDKIEEGMTLAEPIVNNFGQTLLPAGVKLSKNHMRILKTWNIRIINVQSDDSDEDEIKVTPEVLILAKEQLMKRMQWKPKNALELDLFKCSITHLAQSIMKKSNMGE